MSFNHIIMYENINLTDNTDIWQYLEWNSLPQTVPLNGIEVEGY